MDVHTLAATAAEMVGGGKGILAIDESVATCTQRFEALGIESTAETRRTYRELLITAQGLPDYIGGAILFDETLRQATSDGTPFPTYMAGKGIVPGIKVDTGAKPLAGHPGELVTEGLDGLRERLTEYGELGARFAKWRAVISIGQSVPSSACIAANAHALARYAALCQEANIVPIVEPEILMAGDHTLDVCDRVTRDTLSAVFEQLEQQGVALEGIVLKPSMVVPGIAAEPASHETVASRTLRVLRESVPPAVAGIAFLSGGQSDLDATLHLQEMHRIDGDLPWELTFSYGRALQRVALETWAGDESGAAAAKQALVNRAGHNFLAARGEYRLDVDTVV